MNCLDNSKVRQSIRDEVKELTDQYIRDNGLVGELEIRNALKIVTEKEKFKRLKQRQETVDTIAKTEGWIERIKAHPKEYAANYLIERDPFGKLNDQGNYMDYKASIERDLVSSIADNIAPYRDKWLPSILEPLTTWGIKERKRVSSEFINALSGKGTKDVEALAYAEAWKKLAATSHDMMTKAGIDVGEIKNYKMQHLDWNKLYEGKKLMVQKDEFVDYMFVRIDRTKNNPLTQQPWTDHELRMALGTYHEFLKNGARKFDGNSFGATGLNHSHSRVFHYTDEAWPEIMERFGPDDMISGIFGYLHSVASDIAEVKIFGPKPAAGRRQIASWLRSQGRDKSAQQFEQTWNVASHSNITGPRNIDDWVNWGKTGSVARTGTSALLLGSSVISSVFGDPINSIARGFANDINPFKTISIAMKTVKNKEEMFEFLADQKIVHESAFNATSNMLIRLGAEGGGFNKVNQKFSQVITATGMPQFSEAMRQAYETSLRAKLGRVWGMDWESMGKKNPNLQTQLRDSGITEDAWNNVSGKVPTKSYDHFKGEKFIDLDGLKARDAEFADKLMVYLTGESRQAVIFDNAHADRLMMRHIQSGTAAGEMVRYGGQFMKYGASSYQAIWKPMISYRRGNISGGVKAKMLATMVLSGMVLGVINSWSRELARGQTPTPLVNDKGEFNYDFFLMSLGRQDVIPIMGTAIMHIMGIDSPAKVAAFVQGEELGPRATQLATLAKLTPVTNVMYDLLKEIVVDPIASGFDTEELSQAGGKISKYGRSVVGLNNFYAELATRKLVDDTIERVIDANAWERKQRARKRYLKKAGREDWVDEWFR
ncbi:hypothetical protein [Constrictibacter sp. MBR-5]|uniref:hypothetical protein n=1 Tax=Constrictibacter sp. MBR-5 TaxID=3156467 RepID=UPI003399943E